MSFHVRRVLVTDQPTELAAGAQADDFLIVCEGAIRIGGPNLLFDDSALDAGDERASIPLAAGASMPIGLRGSSGAWAICAAGQSAVVRVAVS